MQSTLFSILMSKENFFSWILRVKTISQFSFSVYLTNESADVANSNNKKSKKYYLDNKNVLKKIIQKGVTLTLEKHIKY